MSWTSSVMQCCDINQRLRGVEHKAAISQLGSRVATDPLGVLGVRPLVHLQSSHCECVCSPTLSGTKIWRKKCKCRKRLEGHFLSLAFHFLPQGCCPLSNSYDGYVASNSLGKSCCFFKSIFMFKTQMQIIFTFRVIHTSSLCFKKKTFQTIFENGLILAYFNLPPRRQWARKPLGDEPSPTHRQFCLLYYLENALKTAVQPNNIGCSYILDAPPFHKCAILTK